MQYIIIILLIIGINYQLKQPTEKVGLVIRYTMSILGILLGGGTSSFIIGVQTHWVYDNSKLVMMPTMSILLIIVLPILLYLFIRALLLLSQITIIGIVFLIWGIAIYCIGYLYYTPPANAGSEFSNYFPSETKFLAPVFMVGAAITGVMCIVIDIKGKYKQ